MYLDNSQILTALLTALTLMLFVGLSLYFLIMAVIGKIKGEAMSIFEGRAPVFIYLIHAFAAVILSWSAYAAWFEPATLVVEKGSFLTTTTVEPVKIVLLSDLKWPRTRLSLEKLVDQINSQNPDIVLMAGDMVASSEFAPATEAFRNLKCSRIYGVSGNEAPEADLDFYRSIEAMGLPDLVASFTIGEQRIDIQGVSTYGLDLSLFEAPRSDRLSLLLTHSPEYVPAASTRGYHAYFCGHTLGGQIRFPFAPDVFVPGQFGKLYPEGSFKAGGMSVFVSRGLGMVRGITPELRFFCPPDIFSVSVIPSPIVKGLEVPLAAE